MILIKELKKKVTALKRKMCEKFTIRTEKHRLLRLVLIFLKMSQANKPWTKGHIFALSEEKYFYSMLQKRNMHGNKI